FSVFFKCIKLICHWFKVTRFLGVIFFGCACRASADDTIMEGDKN
uniref:Uncharacterized protein n=1 Tax=Triticum urartu TaxID=4572 RepID=A0A8R7QGV9_TRIUA